MTKTGHFTRLLSSDSESSFSQAPAIPLQAIITSPDPIINANPNTSPNVDVFAPVSPITVGMNEEWPLTEIPQELREPDDDYDSTAAHNTEANSMRTDWKRELFLLLEDPSSSNAAFLVNVFVSVSIVFSAILTTVETIPAFRSTSSSVWFDFETTIVAIFTVEYVLRLIAHSDSLKQLWPFKYSSTIIMTIEVMIVAVKRSMDALGALFFFMVTSVVLFSTLLYFAERDKQIFVDNKGFPSAFDSIPSAFWFVMVTITTTGDMVPTTFVGKLIAFPAMMCGILLIALPSIIVGRNFTLVWEAMRQYRRTNPPATREQNNSECASEEEGPDLRASFESAHSYASHIPPRGYSSMSDELVANQDVMLEQVRNLIKISHQNQAALERILVTLEQNGIKYNPTMTPPQNNMKSNISTSNISSSDTNDGFPITMPEKSASGT
ncbi:7354_t:CDS:2 [Diversispora eburnea]|uniref:7354_t:CDS:1 n=1 Tax=Diversispora eburnea TaxID=1213867 RepID=A0A9N8UY35_9GLOM|nr:7354_t:CDS:2 [Diversispora eburnea]